MCFSAFGSNCTFMELKYIFHRLFPTWRVFKLYLYGIEIGKEGLRHKRNSLFKLYLYGIEIPYPTSFFFGEGAFKLYLYGIEILVRNYNIKQLTVQIVPLWNWNVIIALNDVDVAAFKLYLYGIEIRMAAAMRAKTNSSNCTFMELK